jgi:putative membrane protein
VELLSELHQTNQEAIALGNLAMEKATAHEVKGFGQQLIRDHLAADQKIIALATKLVVQLSAPAPADAKERQNANRGADLIQNLREVQEKKFDEDFLSALGAGHQEMIAMVERGERASHDRDVRVAVEQLLPRLEEQ